MSYTEHERREHLREATELAGFPPGEVVLPTERTLPANGLNFHLLDWGGDDPTPERPAVLFVHGASLTAHTWDLVCLALRDRYRCFALDLRGHGDSDWPPDGEYRLDALRADLEGVVEGLGLGRFILVGMSLGGATSLAYAGLHADRLAGLVVVDTGPETRDAGRRRIQRFVSTAPELESVDAFVERAIEHNPLRPPELLRRSLLHNLRQTPRGTWTWKWDPRRLETMTAEAREHRKTLLWDAVPRISCPTLVVRGGLSENFHDEDAEQLAGALPIGSWLRIEGASHTVQGDQPKALVAALEPFFASVVDGSAAG